MAAGKATYVVIWKKLSQIYSAASLETAVNTPIPKGCTVDDKRVLFASYMPDDETLCLYPVEAEEIQKVEEQLKEKKKKDNEQEQQVLSES